MRNKSESKSLPSPDGEGIKFEDLQDEGRYLVSLRCHDCGHELNSTTDMTGTELKERWTRLCITAGFNSGPCPKGCRSTFSDLNINHDMLILPAKEAANA